MQTVHFMGSNMQRQAVPLIKVDPPLVGTGMEHDRLANYSGMLVKARQRRHRHSSRFRANRIVIDNADEYELRKFGTGNSTSEHVRTSDPSSARATRSRPTRSSLTAHRHSTLSLQSDATHSSPSILSTATTSRMRSSSNERLVKDDAFTSIHIDSFEVEIRETKLGREEFTADIPNVSEKMLRNLDDEGIIRTGAKRRPRRHSRRQGQPQVEIRTDALKRSFSTRSSAAPAKT